MACVKSHVINVHKAPKLGENGLLGLQNTLVIVYGPMSSYINPICFFSSVREHAISRFSCHHNILHILLQTRLPEQIEGLIFNETSPDSSEVCTATKRSFLCCRTSLQQTEQLFHSDNERRHLLLTQQSAVGRFLMCTHTPHTHAGERAETVFCCVSSFSVCMLDTLGSIAKHTAIATTPLLFLVRAVHEK